MLSGNHRLTDRGGPAFPFVDTEVEAWERWSDLPGPCTCLGASDPSLACGLWASAPFPILHGLLPVFRDFFSRVYTVHRVSIRKPHVVHGHFLKHWVNHIFESQIKMTHFRHTFCLQEIWSEFPLSRITPINLSHKLGYGQGSRHTCDGKIFSNMR